MVRGPLTVAASLVSEHRLQTRRLSNCGSRAHSLRGIWDPPGPGLEPMSPALAGRLSTTAPPGKPHRGLLIHADTIIIFGANPFLLVDLETARFASLPAMHISESSTPSAGHSWIHHPGGYCLKGPFLSVLGQLDSKTRTSHLSIWREEGGRGEGEGKRRMEEGRRVFPIPSPLSTQEKLRAF